MRPGVLVRMSSHCQCFITFACVYSNTQVCACTHEEAKGQAVCVSSIFSRCAEKLDPEISQ